MAFAQDLVFYDVETTIPDAVEARYSVIEFGAIVLDRQCLVERESYGTLIKAPHLTKRSREANGISETMLQHAPVFSEVADRIFGILNDRIWIGHNIIRFDNKRIEEEFQRLGRKPPKPSAVVDTLPLLKKTFGARAGDFKMATLGRYFGLGEERHRALDDCRMTIEVMKKCATILYTEQVVGLVPRAVAVPQASAVSSEDTPASTQSTGAYAITPKGGKGGRARKRNRTSSNTAASDDNPAKSSAPQHIIDSLNQAILHRQHIWISYQGGEPRKLLPLRWDHPNYRFVALCYRTSEPIEKHFLAERVVEVRNEEWKLQPESSVGTDSALPKG